MRRLLLLPLYAVLLAGAAGLLGVREDTVEANANGIRLAVDYASVSRAGLSTPLAVHVHRAGGFTEPPRIAMSRSYLALFSTFQPSPTPVHSFTQADWIVWEFAIPVGDSLNVDLGPRLDPSLQSGASGRTALLEDGRPLLEVVFATHVVP